MIWLLLHLFFLTSYHQSYNYEPKDYQIVSQLAVRSIEKLNTDNCELDWNYYATKEYFAFWMDCNESIWLETMSVKKIVVVDIKWMKFQRFRSTNF